MNQVGFGPSFSKVSIVKSIFLVAGNKRIASMKNCSRAGCELPRQALTFVVRLYSKVVELN
uniref:Uncharacterized protein n=1 Tax=Utricularia reniformis TaxID=192314 RepID=A0A1Y0AZ02_9LAMI|nr:hypothetical protein AEK19_MT1427 [Utricularia reniformis]ART30378.1 hypothetical protein AEK19_MT1427 [Utricularia reniformis]